MINQLRLLDRNLADVGSGTAGNRRWIDRNRLYAQLYSVRDLAIIRGCIKYKLRVLAYRCLSGSASQYLSELLQPVAKLEWRLRQIFIKLAAGLAVNTPLYHSDRAFAVAVPHAWNSLPDSLHELWLTLRNIWNSTCSDVHWRNMTFDVKRSWGGLCCLQH